MGQRRTKLLVKGLDLLTIPFTLCILQCVALKHQVCGHRLNVEPVDHCAQQGNTCNTPTRRSLLHRLFC